MPGKIYDLSDLDNFELPPLPSKAKKEDTGNMNNAAQTSAPADNKGADMPANAEPAPGEPVPETPVPGAADAQTADSAAAPAEDDFELPPLPARKPESSGETAASAAIASAAIAPTAPVPTAPERADIAGDFDLPPLPPVRKPVSQAAQTADTVQETISENAPVSENASVSADDFELPPLPVRKAAVDNAGELPQPSEEAADDNGLPPLPARKPESADSDAVSSAAEEISDDDFELPPLPEKKPEETEENARSVPEQEAYEEPVYEEAAPEEYEPEENAREEEKPKPRVSLEDDLDIDLDTVTPADIGIDDPSKALAPMHTAREAQARNVREKMKMDDLAMDMDAPVLDDLSDEYAAPEKRAEDLIERDHLESDEKQVLKQRLQEDLSRRPENFNARASRNMYNKLMEEKKLKIARKGMLISFIPIVMELIAAGICFFTMNWGTYQWLSYVAAFGAFGALLLLIKSKHTKMFSIIISAITVLVYVVPGLVLYALDEKMQADPDYVLHITLAAAAALLNVGAILILIKNEAVNTYYTAKFKRK